MRWEGVVQIGPAIADLGTLVAGVQGSAFLESEPGSSDLPRPSEQWSLVRIYVPVTVQAVWTAAAATEAQVVLQLIRAGVPLWTDSLVLGLITQPGTNTAIGNSALSTDFTNPITLRAGETAPALNIAAAVDQQSDVKAGVGYQTQTFDSALQTPGVIAYEAVTLDEL
jgi:hypothetical protein